MNSKEIQSKVYLKFNENANKRELVEIKKLQRDKNLFKR